MEPSFPNIEVAKRSLHPSDSPLANWEGLRPGTTTLEPKHVNQPGRRAFDVATVFDRDVIIPLRDGHTLRADVFRPAESARVPALVAWSPYGKSGSGYFNLELVQGRVGVPKSATSGYESFEAPDPAEWTARGYAVVNVNARGILGSTGRDGYDAVEHIAALDWCSGKVALVGNSWLAMAQWFIAAERPPHLTCIAPLEGASDFYRETLCRGGVPWKPFWGFLAEMGLFGDGEQEDVMAMLDRYPLMNDYWKDKRARIERIEVPAYVLASWSTALHTVGSFRGYEEIPHGKKWLRVHPTQEWHDLYHPDTVEDLGRFFDCYLKGHENGWESTPPVRLSCLRFNQPPEAYLHFTDWPVLNTKESTLYLSSDSQLSSSPPRVQTTYSYHSDAPSQQADADTEELHFSHIFDKPTRLIGPSRAVLYMSCPDSADLDVFVQLRKATPDGILLQNSNIPLRDLGLSRAEDVEVTNPLKYLGPSGVLRASHRAVDTVRSKPHWPLLQHTGADFVPPGEVVRLEIAIWPTGIRFEKGERLVLKVSGHPMTLAEFAPLRGQTENANRGRHCLFVGGESASRLTIPVVEVE